MVQMKIRKLENVGGLIITYEPIEDRRGYFYEVLGKDNPVEIKQISQSCSSRGVIRGLHIQYAPKMSKMIRCLHGSATFYLVDMRPTDKPKIDQATLFGTDNVGFISQALVVPNYCAVGFEATENNTVIEYLHTNVYNAESSVSIKYNDPTIGIVWPSGYSDTRIISDRDENAMSYTDWVNLCAEKNIFPIDK